MNKFNYIYLTIFLVVSSMLTACGSATSTSSNNYKNIDVNTLTDKEIYTLAESQIKSGNSNAALNTFQDLERLYPYSEYIVPGQVMSSYALYNTQMYSEAEVLVKRFIKLYPAHEKVAYMYYLKGLIYYDQIEKVNNDQEYTKKALMAFEDVIKKFPATDYAVDAKQKALLCADHLAAKELEIGRYYQEKGRYLSAINRFKEVVNYPVPTDQTPEALYRLVESNLAIGLFQEAQAHGAVLGYNYPSSQWYKKAYNLLKKANLIK